MVILLGLFKPTVESTLLTLAQEIIANLMVKSLLVSSEMTLLPDVIKH